MTTEDDVDRVLKARALLESIESDAVAAHVESITDDLDALETALELDEVHSGPVTHDLELPTSDPEPLDDVLLDELRWTVDDEGHVRDATGDYAPSLHGEPAAIDDVEGVVQDNAGDPVIVMEDDDEI